MIVVIVVVVTLSEVFEKEALGNDSRDPSENAWETSRI